MPFVSNDLLEKLLSEISALRQQVAGHQQAIDRVETAAIRHLNEARDVARQALRETRDAAFGQLTTFSADLATIRANTQRFDHPETAAPEAAAEAVQPPQTDTPAASEQNDHGQLLQRAAGISAATLNVHRDTWAFLVEHAGQDKHFHIPGQVTANGGTVEVDVSGPSLVAALTSLQAVHQTQNVDPGTAAIARHLYDRIADTIRAITPSQRSGDGAKPVTITIDDRTKPQSQPAATTEPDTQAPDDGTDGHIGD